MRAIGLAKVTDTDQLIGGSLSIKLDVRAATELWERLARPLLTGSSPSVISSTLRSAGS